MTLEQTTRRSRLHNLVPLALGLALFAAGLGALYHLLRPVNAADVFAQVRATPVLAFAGALAATAAGYVALIGYDWYALRYIGRRLPGRVVALGGFLGYAFGNTIGISVLSGGAVRYRIYSAFGLDAFEVAAVSSYVAVALGFGLGNAGLWALAIHPEALGGLLPLPLNTIRWGAAALAGGGLATLYALSASGARLRLGRFELSLPRPGALTGQLAVTIADIAAAAFALWLLLPAGKPDLASFVAIYAAATMIGVISHVPGGVGVFETVVIAAMPGAAPVGDIAAALLLFRVVYFLLPFALAFVVVSVGEARMAGGAFARLLGEAPAALRPAFAALTGVVPALVAVVAFGLGAYLLMVALLPSVQGRALAEGDVVSAILLEGGTLVSAVAGVVLIILSHGLQRRVQAAFWLTLVALGGGALASLMNGFDLESAGLIAAGALAMLPFRRAFYRAAKLTDGVFSPAWFALVAAVALAAASFFFFVHAATPYSLDLWTEFARSANTPRSLRAGLAASTVMLVFTIFLTLQPSRARATPTSDDEALERAAALLADTDDPQACLALSGDKRLMFAEAGDGFLQYGRQRSTWVALGDPVGSDEAAETLLWGFFETAQQANCHPVFYEASARHLPLFVEMGLTLHKVGEEAVVPLAGFSLAGAKFKSMRAAYNKHKREGLGMELLAPPCSDALFAELADVSQAWLGGKTGREKGFSVGRFERGYLDRFPLAVVRREGKVLAFANVLAPGAGKRVAIDLMRYRPEAASGMMEFLFVALMEHYRDTGAREFSLGVAPLSGLSERRTAQMWNRAGRLMFEHGGAFYNFEGLRAFKQKFRPDWRPRYIALPPGLSPMVAMADVAMLIAGGARGIVGK